MERVYSNGIEPSSSNRDQISQPQDHSRAHSHDRPHDQSAGVSYERLHPGAPDLVLPATFLAVTLLGILFVLVILFIWLRTHLSLSSSKKKYDKSVGIKTKEKRSLRTMESDEKDRSFNLVVDDANSGDGDRTDSAVDDFEFKLPNILDDAADFKYIDELDKNRNVSPPILRMNNNGVGSPKLPESDNTESDSKKNDSSGNSTPSGMAKPKSGSDKFLFPDDTGRPSKSSENKFGKFKMALPDQSWLLYRKPPLDWRGYSINIPKGFNFIDVDMSNESSRGESSSKRHSSTRSPSLEKDDKSPFVSYSGDSTSEFVFDGASEGNQLKTVPNTDNISSIVEVKVQPVATDSHCAIFESGIDKLSSMKSSSHSSEVNIQKKDFKISQDRSCSVRRFGGSSNVGLRICTANENINSNISMEKIEMQNSPRMIDSSVGKENNPSPRFNFSPKFFSSSECKSPKFFGSPEQRSPKTFHENQSKNSSPKVFSGEKPTSPKFTYVTEHKNTRSPLILNRTEDRFVFDKASSENIVSDESVKTKDNNDSNDNVFPINKTDLNLALRYSESNVDSEKTDLEKTSSECHIPEVSDIASIDNLLNDNLDFNINLSDVSCLNNNKKIHVAQSTETDLCKTDVDHEEKSLAISLEVTSSHNQSEQADTSDKIDEIENDQTKETSKTQENTENLTVSNTSSDTANYRRQRLKSISLDSDNAKFIQQNLGLPMVKHLKQENLFDPREGGNFMSLSDENTSYARQLSPTIVKKKSYFNFDDDYSEYSGFDSSNDGLEDSKDSGNNISHNECMDFPDTVDSSCNFILNDIPSVAFNEMQPRFSPKEFENATGDDDKNSKNNKNKRNLTIDIDKRDADLEKELSEYDRLESGEKRMTPKTPTLKIKATSLDSSETLNLSLPQNNTLQVPQNSISVPNTPKRQLKRALSQKVGKLIKTSHYSAANCGGNLNEIVPRIYAENQAGRKLYMNLKCASNLIDSGIFLRENHANLMLFQAAKCPSTRAINASSSSFSRRMGSFDENMVDCTGVSRQITPQLTENRLSLLQKPCDMLGSNLLNFKQNLSVSSTNLKTLPEGVPSNDFDTQPENKSSKKTLLQRRGSNQSLTINLDNVGPSLKYSTLSLQGSNLSLASFGASSHNLANIKNSASNFSLNTDNRQKKNILERRNSNTSLTLNLDYASQHANRLYSGSHCNLQGSHYNLNNQDAQNTGQTKKCLLQRRGSNTSLTLNLQNSNSNLNRCTSNSSLNIHNETKTGQKKGLLERRSSNTSLTLNISNVNCQFDNNRILSVSNYNLETSGSGLSRYNSNQSINTSGEGQKKGLLERRSSNTSLTLNINASNFNLPSSDVPRDIEIDDSVLQCNLNTFKDSENHMNQQRDKHRKSLSTENLFSKSYKSRMFHCKNAEEIYTFGSHDNLWSNSYATDSMETFEIGGHNLTYICGDQENEIIYAFGDRQHIENAGFPAGGPVRNITTKPLSPHSTSEDFKLYLANIQHLQNATNVLSRQQLKDLNSVFQESYSKTECPLLNKLNDPGGVETITTKMKKLSTSDCDDSTSGEYNPQRLLPEPVLPSTEYQKSLLRNLHQEFWDLPTNFQEKPMVFGSHPKNRYKTILPNEHSRVILRAEAGENDEGYINANYIKGHEYSKNCYIATQGPLQNTVYDFWLMVYQNSCQFHRDGCTKTNEERHFGSPRTKLNAAQQPKLRLEGNQKTSIQKIVMLTNLIENGRQKCEKYFPTDLNEELVFNRLSSSCYSSACSGGTFFADTTSTNDASKNLNEDVNMFTIKNIGVTNKTGYTIRKLLVKYRNKFLNSKTEENKISKNCDSVNSDSKDSCKISITEPDDEPKDPKEDSLIVYHYWFDNWADHKCPKDVTALLDLSLDVLRSRLLDFDMNLKSEDSNTSLHSSSESINKERRLSAFQTAKAFFDEVSRSNLNDDNVRLVGSRKNSLASRLDTIKPKPDSIRRESTGAINPIRSSGARPSLFEIKQAELKNKKSKCMLSDLKSDPNIEMPPIIVHCSAGIGRTGCLIAVLNGIKQLKADEKVDILGIVCNMRLNRGGMVQNSEQYELIHKVLCLYEEIGLPDI